MSEAGRGLPLLSGPASSSDSNNADIACRKCNKEFNVLFARSRRCNHCGYSYCHSCSDYQALMPRSGAETGYDAMHVCAFCIEYLTITAAGRAQLKAMSLGKLKKYLNAYSIKTDRAVEKDDLIDAIINARGLNGCLPRANEAYYRKYSVPNRVQPGRSRGLFSGRQGQSSNAAPPPQPPPRPTESRPEFARPDLAPDHSPPPPPPRPNPSIPEFPRPDLGHDHSQHSSQHPQQQPPYVPRATQPQQQQQYNPPPHPPPRPQQQHQAGYNPGYSYAPQPQSNYSYAPPPHPPPQFHTPPPAQGYGYNPYAQQQAPPPTPPHYSRPAQQQPPPQNYQSRPTPPRPASTRPAENMRPPSPPPRPRAASTAPPPNLDQLVTMTPEAIASLSIGGLKSILFTNHVNAGQILEKSDLVKKVLTLVENEKAERERQRRAEEREEMERLQRQQEEREEREREERAREEREREEREAAHHPMPTGHPDGDDQQQDGLDANPHVETASSSAPPTPPRPKPAATPPKAQGSASTLERTGLCVICQDEEANIAIVDCGHMAMCRGCSDLIMASSRECPLCRTRIVTEQRLLRIFKT